MTRELFRGPLDDARASLADGAKPQPTARFINTSRFEFDCVDAFRHSKHCPRTLTQVTDRL